MGRVVESHNFTIQDAEFGTRELQVDIGFNTAGRRVFAFYGRPTGGREWAPIIELDIDIEQFFREPGVDLPPPAYPAMTEDFNGDPADGHINREEITANVTPGEEP